MPFLLKLVIWPALLAIVKSEYPFDIENEDFELPLARNADPTSYRLPEDLDPIHADIEVTPYFETAPDGKEPFTFDGVTTHEIRVSKKLYIHILLVNKKKTINPSLRVRLAKRLA